MVGIVLVGSQSAILSTKEPRRMAQREKKVEIPISLLMTATSLDELEDWLEANDPEFVGDMLRIHDEEMLAGDGRSLDELKKKWNIPS
jgi:hypothetical protein